MSDEQKIVQVDIKKKKASSPIYFGVAPNTGEALTVDAVPRGLACGCICHACGTRLEARKGKVKRHHFAHESNCECLYGSEISVYYAFAEYLKKNKQFYIPDAFLDFNSFKEKEKIQSGSMQNLTSVELINENKKYPPTLICTVDKHRFQIVLNFEEYFTVPDYKEIKRIGEKNNIPVVMVDIDSLESVATAEDLGRVAAGEKGKHWIYNRLAEKIDKRYREAARAIQVWDSRHLCPAQKGTFKNVHSVRVHDCQRCEYCYSFAERLCLAQSRISHVSDFDKTDAEREKEFAERNKLKPLRKIEEHACPRCGAPLRRRVSRNGVFAGCSNYPQCNGSRSVEPITEQVIIDTYGRRR